MDTTIYRVGNSTFIPTKYVVEQTCDEEKIGQQLWQQMYKNVLTSTFLTLEEIKSYATPEKPLQVCFINNKC